MGVASLWPCELTNCIQDTPPHPQPPRAPVLFLCCCCRRGFVGELSIIFAGSKRHGSQPFSGHRLSGFSFSLFFLFFFLFFFYNSSSLVFVFAAAAVFLLPPRRRTSDDKMTVRKGVWRPFSMVRGATCVASFWPCDTPPPHPQRSPPDLGHGAWGSGLGGLGGGGPQAKGTGSWGMGAWGLAPETVGMGGAGLGHGT